MEINLKSSMHALAIAVVIAFSPYTTGADSTFKGFWKVRCTDAFGIQIIPQGAKLYSVSFCGPGGCDAPGTWAPNTPIIDDSHYKIIDDKTIEMKGHTYLKCTDETNPKLDFSTMKDTPSQVTYIDPSKDIPDYDNNSPFTGRDSATVTALEHLVDSLTPQPRECVTGSIKVWPEWSMKLYSNVCAPETLTKLRALVKELAPVLNVNRLMFRLALLDESATPALLVGHVDLSKDPAPYPFLSLWRIRFARGSYTAVYAGPFLNGRVHAVEPFGELSGRSVVFVRHQSCLECEPTVYLTPMDFDAPGDAKPYEFTYADDHAAFDATLEYSLPGMGHTVDASVETRILPASAEGPHLLQHFRPLDGEGPDEWWTFTCKSYKCDYTEAKGAAPKEFKARWATAPRL